MNTSQFNQLTKKVYDTVFRSFESYDPDLVEADYNLDSISICFQDGTRFVVNRQPPVKQLWLATKNKGYHFNYDEVKMKWICDRTNQEFTEVFNKSVSDLIKQPYQINLQ
jgi:CyaY protein